MVTLFGTIVRELDARILFRIAPRGDALAYGLAGDVWLARHQCIEIVEATNHLEPDAVRISENLARAKAAAGKPPTPRGRR